MTPIATFLEKNKTLLGRENSKLKWIIKSFLGFLFALPLLFLTRGLLTYYKIFRDPLGHAHWFNLAIFSAGAIVGVIILWTLVRVFLYSFHLSVIYFVGMRYLKKRFTSYLAVAGVAVGVMVLVIVLSVMGGFQKAFWERLRSSSGDLTLESLIYYGISDYGTLQSELEKVPGVVHTAPFINSIVLMESTGTDYGFLKGIDLEQEKKMGKWAQYLLSPRKTYLNLYGYKDVPTNAEVHAVWQKLEKELALHKIKITEKNTPREFPSDWPPSLRLAYDEYWSILDTQKFLEGQSDTLQLKKTKSGLPGIILGIELIKSFGLKIGSTITLTTVSGLTLDGLQKLSKEKMKTREQDFEVVGTVKVGIYSQDRRSFFAAIPDVQKFVGISGKVSGINIECEHFERAEEIKEQIKSRLVELRLYEDLVLKTWKEKNINLFQAVQMEKVLLTILLSFIVLVAGFMIFSILSMMVVEKTKDMGIIKALGSPSDGIMAIFLYQGALIGFLGTLLGLCGGLWFAYNINSVADNIKKVTGWHPFPPQIYYLDRIPISVDMKAIAVICLVTFVVSFIFALYPAYRASRFNAIEALRYE